MAFDQRHLTALYSDGLITEVPHELAAFPVVEVDKQVRQDLIDWNVVDPATGALTAPAADLLAGITDYQWALSGVLLLYSERRPVDVDIPEEFRAMGVQYAVREIPRVGFLIGYRNETLTTLTIAGGNITIATDAVAQPVEEKTTDLAAAQIITNLCDPQSEWQPYPMSEVAIPASAAESLATSRPDNDGASPEQLSAAKLTLSEAKMARSTSDELTELMGCNNVAAAQIGLTLRTPLGRTTVMNNALGLMFFLGARKKGTVVSYPTRSFDGAGWITYEPATVGALAKGIAALRRGFNAADAPIVTL